MEICARSIILDIFYLMQPRQPHIRKCQNSNSFFSKKGTKTTICFNIRGPMFLSNQCCAPSMAQFGKKYFECSDCKIWLQRLKKLSTTFFNKEIFFHGSAQKTVKKSSFKNQFTYILYIQTIGVFKKQPEFQTAVEAA